MPTSDAECVVELLQADAAPPHAPEDPRLQLQLATSTVRVDHSTSYSLSEPSVEHQSCGVQTDADPSTSAPRPDTAAARDDRASQTEEPQAPTTSPATLQLTPRARGSGGSIALQVRLPTLDYSPPQRTAPAASAAAAVDADADSEERTLSSGAPAAFTSPDDELSAVVAEAAATAEQTELLFPPEEAALSAAVTAETTSCAVDASTQYENDCADTDAPKCVSCSSAVTQTEAPSAETAVPSATQSPPAPVTVTAAGRNVKLQVRPSQLLDFLRDADVQTDTEPQKDAKDANADALAPLPSDERLQTISLSDLHILRIDEDLLPHGQTADGPSASLSLPHDSTTGTKPNPIAGNEGNELLQLRTDAASPLLAVAAAEPVARQFVSKKLQVRPSALGAVADACAQTDASDSEPPPPPSDEHSHAPEEAEEAGSEQRTPTARSPARLEFDQWDAWNAVSCSLFKCSSSVHFYVRVQYIFANLF